MLAPFHEIITNTHATPFSAEVKNKWQIYASIRPMRLNREIYLMSMAEQTLLPQWFL